ncbi:hypothetical protein BJ742DRAFT_791957 [Cladochytrium replicatum]|nr:hypothetical protein BJ742DRAFT_791957 [Cladochytrium replicatum]
MAGEDLKALGNKAFSSGAYKTAIDYFTQAIEQDSTNHVLYSNRSAAYTSLKDYSKALEDAEKTVSIKPDWSKGYSRKGAALHGLQQFREAAEAYKAGLKLEPTNAQMQKALDDAENELSKEGLGGIGKMFGPDVFAKMATNPQLSPFLSQPDVMQKVKEIQANPRNVNMYLNDPRIMQIVMGLMGINANVATPGDFAGADGSEAASMEEDAKPGPAPTPKSAPPPPQPKEPVPTEEDITDEEKEKRAKRAESDKAKEQGNAEYKKRKFEAALEHYNRAWELDPTNVAVLTNKAAVLFEMKNYEETIKVCDEAVERGRELRVDYKLVSRAFGRAGNAYLQLDDLDNAIKYFNKSLSEHRTPDILNKLREVEKLKKERDELNYQNPELSNVARERGNGHFKDHHYPEAMKEYNEAVRRNPKDARNYSNRAACFIKLMAFPEAEKDCDRAIELDENFVRAYVRKAAIYQFKKDYMKAIDICNLAKEKDVEGKHTKEIDAQIMQAYAGLNEVQTSGNREEITKRAMQDPEVQAVLGDPVMQTILQQMQQDPNAARDHMKNPAVAAKLRILINAGILRVA